MTTVVAGTIHDVGIAQAKVARAPDMLRIVVGSCVGVAMYDPSMHVGGMIHIVLGRSDGFAGKSAKFADTGIDLLIDMMLDAGASTSRLVAKIAGGAAMFGDDDIAGIGARNVEAVRAELRARDIRVVAEDVRGSQGRKMLLDPASGTVTVECVGQLAKAL